MLLSGQALGVCTHGVEPNPRRATAAGVGGARAGSSRRVPSSSLPPEGGLSCLAGLASALQRRHGQQRTASNAGRWGRCRARIDGAFGRTAREWCSACAVRLDPCSSSDVLTLKPSQSWGKRNLGLPEVGFLCCIPNARALSSSIDRPSPLALGARGEPRGRPRVPRRPRSVEGRRGARAAVGILGCGRRGGHGASIGSYLPRTMLPANDGRARLGPVPAPPGRPGSCDAGVGEECYLVDPASSHMLVSKIKPCMCKYEQIQTVKLRMAH